MVAVVFVRMVAVPGPDDAGLGYAHFLLIVLESPGCLAVLLCFAKTMVFDNLS